VEAVGSHSGSLEPRFDVVPVVVVEMTAQVVPRKGSQVAASINVKLCLGDIVFLGKPVEQRRRGVSPVGAEYVFIE
jgi:hypothetical protein